MAASEHGREERAGKIRPGRRTTPVLVKIGPDRTWTFEDPRRISEKIGADQTGPGHLKTTEEYQVAADRCSSGDSCLNLTREDWTRPDLDIMKTPEEYQVIPVMTWGLLSKPVDQKTQFVQRVGCPDWEKPVVTDQPTNADLETGLQQEEEPDFCRQGCVKEDGEE
ncbi:hypothetical protein Bbelb_016760 [Branchiostoma belcheri]|nr:hypothetical protein Bbelb_016760 [Branchiostoma belcheri]